MIACVFDNGGKFTIVIPEVDLYLCAADFSFAQLAKGKKSRA
jgi:hypothetical protein